MREVPLRPSGLVAIVDDDDFVAVAGAQPAWQAYVDSRARTVYVRRLTPRGDGSGRRTQLLHTFLTGWPQVDHVNGDGLDNRRENLRPATHAENARNRRKRAETTSQFKGVSWRKQSRKWVAHIVLGPGIHRHLGYFVDEELAGRAYDAAAREAFGEFAALNFPLAGERGAL